MLRCTSRCCGEIDERLALTVSPLGKDLGPVRVLDLLDGATPTTTAGRGGSAGSPAKTHGPVMMEEQFVLFPTVSEPSLTTTSTADSMYELPQ